MAVQPWLRLSLLAGLVVGGVIWFALAGPDATNNDGDRTEQLRSQASNSNAIASSNSLENEFDTPRAPRVETAVESSRRTALSNAAPAEELKVASAYLTIKAIPTHTAIVQVIARPTTLLEQDEWKALENHLGSGHQYELATGSWELLGISSEGNFSALTAVLAEHGQYVEAIFDFRLTLTIKGLVYDGVFAQRLEGARATIAAHNRSIVSKEVIHSDPAAARRGVLTDSEGHFELRSVHATKGAVVVRCDGYADAEVEIQSTAIDAVLDLGNIPLTPIESLEVRLVGIGSVDPTAFKIREGWDSAPVAFDDAATAWVELPKAVPDLTLNLFSPDGVNLRIDVPGMAMDHNPLEIDLSEQVEVEVVIDDWEPDFRSRSLNLCVVSLDHRGLQRFSVVEVDAERASALAWGSATAMASIFEVMTDADVFLAARTVALDKPMPTPVHLSIGESAGWLFIDEAGVPQGDALIYAANEVHSNRFSMALVADGTGRVTVPLGIDGMLFVNAHLPDGTIQTDLELRAPSVPGEFKRVDLSRAEVYDVVLSCGGSPLPWHRVSICSEIRVDLGVMQMSNKDGELGDLRFRGGSRPRVVIHDPRLFEFGQSYPLRPGMNQIEVRRAATLVVEIAPNSTTESLVVGGAEFAGWLASGKVKRDISQMGDVTQVRYSPVPLGEYACTLAGEAKGPLAVSRAGATFSYRL